MKQGVANGVDKQAFQAFRILYYVDFLPSGWNSVILQAWKSYVNKVRLKD